MLFFLPCDERLSGVHIMSTCSFDHLNAVSAHYIAVEDQVCSHIIFRTRMFEVSGKERPTETTCCWLWEILNIMSCAFLSQTRWLDLTYHLMHDSDLFTLQSIQCRPV